MPINSFFNVISDNINFDIVIECIVLMGILITKFVNLKKSSRKEVFLKLLFLFSLFVFFNLAFIVDVFTVPQIPIFIIMGVCFIAAVTLILVFLFRYSKKINKSYNIVLLITIVFGMAFYIIENVLGFDHQVPADIIEVGIMLSIFISLFISVVSFLIMGERRNKK